MKLQTIDIAYHRNGICGAPFIVVLFHDGGSHKLAILFDADRHCAVLDVDKLHTGDIAFGSNSFRGDRFEPYLRQAIAEPSKSRPRLNSLADKPAIAVVSVRGGLVEEVRANQDLHILIEDWDSTEVRPSHDTIIAERMLPGEEAAFTDFFQPESKQQGD